MTLSLDEFLRRFLLHLLPDGFVRIRNFGFLAETALGPFFIGGSVGDSGHRKWFFQLGRVF